MRRVAPPRPGDVAVVTGAARGFGRVLAERLAGRGLQVVVADVDEVGVRATAHALGPQVRAEAADVRDVAALRRLAGVAAALGPLRVWVNNAGVSRTAKTWEHDDAEVDLLVDVNLRGVLHGSRVAVEAMREVPGGGHVLNLGSMSAFGPVPGLAVYAATKAAVVSATTSLQGDLDLAGIPVRVHVLCPDAADTHMVRELADREDAAILFSGGGLLAAERVADAGVALLEGRRIVRAVPSWRAATLRAGGLVPTAGLPLLRGFRLVGDRLRDRVLARSTPR